MCQIANLGILPIRQRVLFHKAQRRQLMCYANDIYRFGCKDRRVNPAAIFTERPHLDIDRSHCSGLER